MTRKLAFICFNNVNTQPLPLLYFTIMYPAAFVIMFLLVPFFAPAVHAEERKIFTDSDLEKYNARPMVDQETVSRSEEALNSYLMKRSAELLAEKETVKREEMRKQLTEEARKSAVQKKRVTVTHVPASVPQKRVIVTQTPASASRSTGRT
ncbi:MAG: hypothetical protein HZB62_03710 [Nitrospirae bacterium]|nr:hypothetical protein [Nitrospirota bacterium]